MVSAHCLRRPRARSASGTGCEDGSDCGARRRGRMVGVSDTAVTASHGWSKRAFDPVIESNVWHVRGRDADLVIDSGNGFAPFGPPSTRFADGRPVTVVVTHGHFDHWEGCREFEDRRGHAADQMPARQPLPMRVHQEAPVPRGRRGDVRLLRVPRAAPDRGRRCPRRTFDVAGWSGPGAELTAPSRTATRIDLGDRVSRSCTFRPHARIDRAVGGRDTGCCSPGTPRTWSTHVLRRPRRRGPLAASPGDLPVRRCIRATTAASKRASCTP